VKSEKLLLVVAFIFIVRRKKWLYAVLRLCLSTAVAHEKAVIILPNHELKAALPLLFIAGTLCLQNPNPEPTNPEQRV